MSDSLKTVGALALAGLGITGGVLLVNTPTPQPICFYSGLYPRGAASPGLFEMQWSNVPQAHTYRLQESGDLKSWHDVLAVPDFTGVADPNTVFTNKRPFFHFPPAPDTNFSTQPIQYFFRLKDITP
jgi:hypothetical protein